MSVRDYDETIDGTWGDYSSRWEGCPKVIATTDRGEEWAYRLPDGSVVCSSIKSESKAYLAQLAIEGAKTRDELSATDDILDKRAELAEAVAKGKLSASQIQDAIKLLLGAPVK